MLEIRRQVINSVSDSKAAYDQVYGSRGIRLSDSFYLWLLSLLGIHEGETLLDVSCGEGILLKFATHGGVRSYGIEVSEVAARNAQVNADRAHVVVADGETLPWPDGHFDYVTNIGSLEHYLHPELSIREMARVLREDGRACILVPNSFGLWGNIKRVWQTGDIFDDGYQPIQRYCTRNRWTQFLTENGLRPYKVLKHEREAPRTRKDALSFLRHPIRLVRLALLPLVPLNLSDRFVFLCHAERREAAHGN